MIYNPSKLKSNQLGSIDASSGFEKVVESSFDG